MLHHRKKIPLHLQTTSSLSLSLPLYLEGRKQAKLSHDLRLKVAFMLLFLKKEHLSMLLARNYEAIEDC